MKILLFLLPLMAMAQSSVSYQLRALSTELGINVSINGKCLYTRNELNHIELHNLFKSPVKDELSHLLGKDLNPFWNCIYLKRNFKRDIKSFFITGTRLEKKFAALKKDKTVQVNGKIRYVGFVPKKYRYDLEHKNGVVTAVVKVHFNYKSLPVAQSRATMQVKIDEAQDIWNRQMPENYRFRFEIADSKADSFYSVKLKPKFTRGPYDVRWSLEWSGKTIAHEFGHMLGLDDEYDQITGSTMGGINYYLMNRETRESTGDESIFYAFFKAQRCNNDSFMCNHARGIIQKWHIYTIFKRFFK